MRPCTTSCLRASQVFQIGIRSNRPQQKLDQPLNSCQAINEIIFFDPKCWTNICSWYLCTPRITHPCPLSSRHSPNNTIKQCIGSFSMIDDMATTSLESFLALYLVILPYGHIEDLLHSFFFSFFSLMYYLFHVFLCYFVLFFRRALLQLSIIDCTS